MMVKFEIKIPDDLFENYRKHTEEKHTEDSCWPVRDLSKCVMNISHDNFTGQQDYVDSNVVVWERVSENEQGVSVVLADCNNRHEVCKRLIRSFIDSVNRICNVMDIMEEEQNKFEKTGDEEAVIANLSKLLECAEDVRTSYHGSNERFVHSLFAIERNIKRNKDILNELCNEGGDSNE